MNQINLINPYSKTPNCRGLVTASMVLAGSLLLLSCSQAPQHEAEMDSVAESVDSVDMTDVGSDSTIIVMNDIDDASILPSASVVQNPISNSDVTLNTTAASVEIAGKKLIINVQADFKVADVVKSSNAIETLTQQQGGYVAQNNISNYAISERIFQQGDQDITLTTYSRQANMTLRIPRTKVSEFLRQLQQQMTFLNDLNFTAEDVTLDLYRQQLESKLNGDMADELSGERLNSRNAKDQSSNINSISATYAARQQQELAKLQRMQIADQVKFSTIILSFSQPDSVYKQVSKNLDAVIVAEQPSFSTQADDSLLKGWNILKVMVLGIISLWWLWLLVVIAIILFVVLKKLHQWLLHKQSQSDGGLRFSKHKVESDHQTKVADKDQ